MLERTRGVLFHLLTCMNLCTVGESSVEIIFYFCWLTSSAVLWVKAGKVVVGCGKI